MFGCGFIFIFVIGSYQNQHYEGPTNLKRSRPQQRWSEETNSTFITKTDQILQLIEVCGRTRWKSLTSIGNENGS